MIYSEKNLSKLEKNLEIITSLDDIQDAVIAIEKNGFDAVIYKKWTAAGWSEYLLKLAEDALTDIDKEYLNNVRTFWNYSKQAC